jgi:hypothetical protein
VFDDNAAALTNSLIGFTTNSLLKTLTYNVTNAGGQLQFYLKPPANFTGQVAYQLAVSPNSLWYDEGEDGPFYYLTFYFTFGDTPINAQTSPTPPQWPGTFTNLLLATFTNGVTGSAIANFTASIQWGDDSITAGVIATNAARMKEVLGSHTYTNSGIYPIAITIQSGLGVTAVVSNGVTVVPSLSLTHLGTNMVAAWPAWAYQFGLQSSSNLTGTVWTGITNYPALSGFQNVLSNTTLPGNRFFRLQE